MKRITLPLIALILAFCFAGCATGNIIVQEDLSPAVLIQRAQEALDRNRYNIAQQYYQVLMERFSFNIEMVVEAEYGIAHIYYKQGRYGQAKERFNALLDRYEAAGDGNLPMQFKVLSERVLQIIEEKEHRRFPFSRRAARSNESRE